MGSFSQSSFSSPVVVLPPPQLLSHNYNMATNNSIFPNTSPFRASPAPASWPQPSPATSIPTAGRKRSRDEAAENLEEEYFTASSAPVQESEEDWEYGEGMVLIKPNGYIIDASSQTGTWAEERAPIAQPQTPPVAERPPMRCHKSQRLDQTPAQLSSEEVIFTNGISSAPSPPKSGLVEPMVDDFTLHLGIGWSRISNDEHLQAAARGWAKYIENHYPITDVQLRLQSRGLSSYLVEAREGWFLFGEDLKQGRLVSQSLERAFNNLRSTPPVFDSDVILVAAVEMPKADVELEREMAMSESQSISQEASMGGTVNQGHVPQQVLLSGLHDLHEPAGQACEVEMDMS